MVERTFPDGLEIPVTNDGAAACVGVVDRNAEVGVTWVQTTAPNYQEANK
jgi:hypothetical protein